MLMSGFAIDENIFGNTGLGVGTGFLSLSTSIIYADTDIISKPAQVEYTDVACNHDDWVFYEGSSTGDISDAIISLKNTKQFPTAIDTWGSIYGIAYIDSGNSGVGEGVFFYHNLSSPVEVDKDVIIVFLGSITLGDGDIVIQPV